MALTSRSVLAVGAHPDDIEYGCFGTLLRLRDAGASIRSVILTGEGTSREEDSRRALEPLGPLDVRSWIECSLEFCRMSVADVERHLEGVDLVLTTTRWDTHQDHQTLEGIVLAACRRRRVTILGYDIISATGEFRPSLFVDVGQQMGAKLAALACHRSYSNSSYMQPQFVRAWHADRQALGAGVSSVERFHIYQMFD